MIDRTKLAKILGMLGSAHDGEILAAAKQAAKLVADAQMTWFEILSLSYTDFEEVAPIPTQADMIAFVLDNFDILTDWERGFIANIQRWRGTLTPKQRDVLEDVIERVKERR